jgi:myo-inositol-1(or 4)-monophosphatase
LPASDLPLLLDAAEAAGAIAMRYWRKSPEAWDKGAGAGPVSEADLAVNVMLARELRAARPGYGWLSEETPDDPARLATARQFILDPIDGTRAFLDGNDSFAHALAVAEAGQIVAAVVHLPAKGLTYAAVAGGAATLNGAVIRASDRAAAEGATVLAAKAALMPEHWLGGQVPGFQRMFRASLAWRLCLVAEGQFDAMLTLRPTWEWDAAAGSLIAERAGARVTDRRGRVLAFNAPDPRADGLIAGAAGVQADLLGRLAG